MTERLVLNIEEATMKHLNNLASYKNVTKGEIIGRAVSLYSWFDNIRADNPTAQLCLDRGNGMITEVCVPGEDND
jgi:hypothetical protein